MHFAWGVASCGALPHKFEYEKCYMKTPAVVTRRPRDGIEGVYRTGYSSLDIPYSPGMLRPGLSREQHETMEPLVKDNETGVGFS